MPPASRQAHCRPPSTPTARATWQGAALPVETTEGANKFVLIAQTESRAILSWNRFDVGANTTLTFNQKLAGVAQKDWVAVNRVVDPLAAPSHILGKIKADGTVVIINRNGVIFNNGAQVSANSLLASSLDIGNFLKPGARPVPGSTSVENGYLATTLQERNNAFLQNGLLQVGIDSTLGGQLTSTLLEKFHKPGFPSWRRRWQPPSGAVTVERGASIDAGKGGFVILTGPQVTNDGKLTATEGQ